MVLLTLEHGCVQLFAILGIHVEQMMKLEHEDKAFSVLFLPRPVSAEQLLPGTPS